MPIQFFSGHQDDVFIPAMIVLLIGAAIVAVPFMFAPRVARMRQRRAIVLLAAVVAVATVVSVVVLALPGFGVIDRQVVALRADVQTTYGIALTKAQATDLMDGDSMKIPGVAYVRTATGAVERDTEGKAVQDKVLLVRKSPGEYVLTTKGVKAELPHTN